MRPRDERTSSPTGDPCGAAPPDVIANATPAAGPCVSDANHPEHPVTRRQWHWDGEAYSWDETHWKFSGPEVSLTEAD